MSPEELINLSLQYEVEIESFSKIPPAVLLTFSFKGSNPLGTARVPLYLAFHLQSLLLCSIIRPRYISKNFIASLIQREKTEANFVELPEFFFEHTALFMSNDIESAVYELRTLRSAKIRKGLNSLDGKALYVTGLSRWEFNEFKKIIVAPMVFGRHLDTNQTVNL